MLASATLYVMDAHGNSKCDYLRSILYAPLDRISTPTPVIEPSIYRVPTVFIPTPSKAADLCPPSNRERDGPQWHTHLAQQITVIAHQAKGGTLVLLTAYQDIEALATLLKQSGIADERIVAPSANQKFKLSERQFREKHAAGMKPILLGLGTAWTGIDLADTSLPPNKDTLLTDLVIGRVPVGLNRTNAMNHRVERLGMYPIVNEALLTFKQGLGRLIRRNGVKDRKIWILDGRIFGPWPGLDQLGASIRRLLREYRDMREF